MRYGDSIEAASCERGIEKRRGADMTLKGKVAVITGASSGIGQAIAELFAQQGARVAAVAGRNKDAVDRLSEDIRAAGGEATAWQCDVAREDQVQALFEAVISNYHKIDILINSAGIIGPAVPVEKMALADWDRVFQVNVGGLFLCCKHGIPRMLVQQSGSIINLSSTAGLRASLISPCYSATKGAIVSLTKSLALAYAPRGLRINCICPGTIETPMLENFFNQEPDLQQREVLRERFVNRHPIGRFGTAAEVAQAALYLASDVSSFVTGINLVVDGGISL
jgi:NAD(P)-dependent dehydrogenase (short-subunit alcohol dehydrogenase family)